jgi:poly-gamma-glutamate capsule biosynthesis protein CapA/YwtB (metallophosphatase superfamily)
MFRIVLFLFIYVFSFKAYTAGKIIFNQAPHTGQTITIAAVGDILLHIPLQATGLKNNFESLWEVALPILQSVDIAYANLEGPVNDNNHIGTGFPLFSYPASLVTALKKSGFTIISTANNHILDRFSQGIDNTIHALDNAGIAHSGATTRNLINSSSVYIMEKKGIRIAWIACTEHTNGIADVYQQVLYCYKNKDKILQTINQLKEKVDAIIVMPHWGEEYQIFPNNRQIQFAHQVLNAGATIILGSHPHVLQSAEKFITTDGRETFVIYSLGNFVSFQGSLKNRTSIILLLGLTKTAEGTFINGMEFVPIYMQNRGESRNIQLIRVNEKNATQLQIISRVIPLENIKW